MTRIGYALVGLAVGGGFYLLLIDTVSPPELYAGAGATLLAYASFEAARELGFAEASFSASWFARSWQVLWRVPVAIVLVSRQALAQLVSPARRRGTFRAVPFDAGGEGARDVGRRALAEALGSLAPNTIVIGIDPDRDLLLVHQLYDQGGREELDVLALEALDSIGAGAYALIGLGGLIFAGTFFKNFLPIGSQGMLLSSGMMPLNSIAVGIEVTGAFLLTWTEFLDQALIVERGQVSSR